MSSKVTCSSCGHSWNKSDSSKKDATICHICGKDNTMKDGGWLDKFDSTVAKSDATAKPKPGPVFLGNPYAKEMARRQTYVGPKGVGASPAMKKAAEDRIAKEKRDAQLDKIANAAQYIGGGLEVVAPFTGPVVGPALEGAGTLLTTGSSAYLSGRDVAQGNYGSALMNAGFGGLGLAAYSPFARAANIPANTAKVAGTADYLVNAGQVANTTNDILQEAADVSRNVHQRYGRPIVDRTGVSSSLDRRLFDNSSNNSILNNFKGNYQNILNNGLDIHDVRLRYHNNHILDLDEIDMLNQFGKGNVENYRKATTKDIAGSVHLNDLPEPEFNESNFKNEFFGKNYDKVDVPDGNSQNTLNIAEGAQNSYMPIEQNINVGKSWNPDDFIRHNYEPYERTATSREADAWLSEHYSDPLAKQKFIDYGGTEAQWLDLQNSLENPIRSNYTWGKNQPAGVYNRIFNQASVPLDASVGVGVHEGAHKTGIVLNKKNTVLPKLWNDLTDAVREIPSETYPEIMRMRSNMGWKPGTVVDEAMLDKGLETMSGGYGIPYKIKDKGLFLDIINRAPAVLPYAIPAAIGTAAATSQQPEQQRNGGWLDKYNDGGPIQENYNDASTSFPPNFVGQGYDTTGRNYSPAWGGQFAMGGSLPGATGSMYARVGAPSKGPHRNQVDVTDASAQDGIEIGADGIPIDNKTKKGNTSVKSTYANKKQDLHKLEGQLHTNLDIDKAIESSQNYIQNKDRGNYWGLHNGPLDAIRHTASAAQTSSQLANMFPGMKYNPGIMLGSILGTNAMGLAHELSSPNPWEERASDLYNNLVGSIIGVMPGDEIKRNERITKALNNNTLSNLKGKNSGDRPFDPIIKNTIDKDKKGFFLPGKGPISNEWLDFREGMQNGGEMKYYQEGLDWKPKSISKNGSQLTKLDQLTNFTNYNTKQPGGWLDRYDY